MQSTTAVISNPSTPDLRSAVLPWRVVGAAALGTSHTRTNQPCQDAQAYRLLSDGTLLVALADGAGSARFSDQGARCAVDAALLSLETFLVDGLPADTVDWQTILLDIFTNAREAVFCLAEVQADPFGEDPAVTARDFAATLTCVIAANDVLVVGQVGDGAVIAADAAGELFAVTRVQRGEYANETHFLTEMSLSENLAVEIVSEPVAALAVMSDGLIRLAMKMPAQEPHAPFFQPLFRFAAGVEGAVQPEDAAAQQLVAFLGSERVNARTDDDKSLVLAVRQVDLPALTVRVHRESMDTGSASTDTIELSSSAADTVSAGRIGMEQADS